MAHNTPSVNTKISKHTSYFGIGLRILILALIVVFYCSLFGHHRYLDHLSLSPKIETFQAPFALIEPPFDGRILVSECADNGNLHQWLYGFSEQASPLTWAIRMNIIRGIGKGLAYLHEDIEPKIIHQNLKSSHILLDHHLQCIDVTIHSLETSGRVSSLRISLLTT
uniref:non-specific serine/threonine protein kinase n=1 Tax=Salix viminalis TaxID=40686 RepID=A0A6N2N677_SALVM